MNQEENLDNSEWNEDSDDQANDEVTNDLEDEIIDWEKQINVFRRDDLLCYLKKKYNFPITSKLSKKNILLELWNKGNEVRKELYLIKQLSDNLDRQLFFPYASKHGISLSQNSKIREVAIKLFLEDSKFLYEGSALSWREKQTSFLEIEGKEGKRLNVSEEQLNNLEKVIETETKKEDRRVKIKGMTQEKNELRISIYIEEKVTRYLKFDEEKELINDFYRPVNRISTNYNTKTGVLKFNSGRSKHFKKLIPKNLGKILFNDEDFFTSQETAITSPIKALQIERPEIDPLSRVGIYSPIEILITKLDISFEVETYPKISIESENVEGTINKFFKDLDFKAGNIDSIRVTGIFKDSDNNKKKVNCTVKEGKAPIVDQIFRQYFEKFLESWGLRFGN